MDTAPETILEIKEYGGVENAASSARKLQNVDWVKKRLQSPSEELVEFEIRLGFNGAATSAVLISGTENNGIADLKADLISLLEKYQGYLKQDVAEWLEYAVKGE